MRALLRIFLLAISVEGSATWAAPVPESAPAAQARRSDRHGDALPDGAYQRLGSTQYRNGAGILTIAYSPDGKRIASAGGTPWAAQGVSSGDKTIRIWDIASGKEVRQLNDHPQGIGCLAFSPDSKFIAAATIGDASLRIWEIDANKGPRVINMNQAGAATMTFAFSADGKQLALSRGQNQEIVLLDFETGKEVRVFGRHSAAIDSLTFAKDGKLASKCGPVVRLWDPEKGEEIRLFRPKNYHTKVKFLNLETRAVPIFSTAPAIFSPDDKTLAFEGNDSTLYLFDRASGKETRRFVCQGAIASASYSPDGKRILTGSHDNTMRVWDVETGKELQHIEGHFGGYAVGMYSPLGKVFATGGGDHSVRFWDADTAKPLPARDGHQGELITASFHPDGKTVVTVGRDNCIRTWDRLSGRELRHFMDDRDTIDRVAFSADGRFLATYSEDSESTRVWELLTGKVVRELPGKAFSIAFGPGFVAVGGIDNKVHAWEVATGKRLKQFDEIAVDTRHLAFSGDGKKLGAILIGGGSFATFDAQTGKPVDNVTIGNGGEQEVGMALSHDGSRAALLRPGGMAVLLDMKGGRVSQLEKPGGPAFSNLTGSVCFSPDGRTLAVTGAGNSAVVLWEVASGTERVDFTGHRGPLTFVAYAPDGRSVASGSWDTTVLLWDVYGTQRPALPDLPAHELDEAWKELAEADGAKGFGALRKLVVARTQAVPLFARQLKPIVPVGKDEMTRMLKNLDSENYDVRQKAFDDLDRLGSLAEEALRKALAQELSLEARRKVEQLLEKLREGPTPAGLLRSSRALEALEVIGTPEARSVLEKVAAGAETSPLTRAARESLARLPKPTRTTR